MNRKHSPTLKLVFTDPVSPSVRWSDIEALLEAAGADTIEGAGSAVKFTYRGVEPEIVMVFREKKYFSY